MNDTGVDERIVNVPVRGHNTLINALNSLIKPQNK